MPEIVMPRLSDSMEEGVVLKWLKQVGDEVAVGDELVEIETDKANMAYESDVAGTLTEILAQEGDALPIGEPIAIVGDPAEGRSKDAKGPGPQAAGPVADASPTVLAAQGGSAPRGAPASTPPAEETGRVKASPLARRVARDSGIDLSEVEGTGPGGR
ncbi:MAG TPA: biotin/lipoyl-containing protein, partial [Solirubrobacterales bacterium]|nr:biotin/lipoyl-containing protein [Solirubrobacterales bacterium]